MIFKKQDGTVITEIKWQAPTTREDGDAYVSADHQGYELGTSNPDDPNDGFTPWVAVPAAYDVTSWPVTELNLQGEGSFEIALRTVDKGGRVSVWSDPLVLTSTLANPSAPAGFDAS